MHIRRCLLVTAMVPCLPFASAQSSGGEFSISNSTTDPATAAKGGAFALTATLGQPATAALGAGAYRLTGGFNAVGHNDDIFRNGFEP